MVFKYLALASSITYVGNDGFLLKKDETGATADETMIAGPDSEPSFLSTQVEVAEVKETKEKMEDSSFLSTQVKPNCDCCSGGKGGCLDDGQAGAGAGQNLNRHAAPPEPKPSASPKSAELIAAAKVQLSNLKTNAESAEILAERVKTSSKAILRATGEPTGEEHDSEDGDKKDDEAKKDDGKNGEGGTMWAKPCAQLAKMGEALSPSRRTKNLSKKMTKAELKVVSDNVATMRDDHFSIQITVGAAGLGGVPGLPEEIDGILQGIPEPDASDAVQKVSLEDKNKILRDAANFKNSIKLSNDEATSAREAAEGVMGAILDSMSDEDDEKTLKITYTAAIAKGDLDQLTRRVAIAKNDIDAKTQDEVSKMTPRDKAPISSNLDRLKKLNDLTYGDIATAIAAAVEESEEDVDAAIKMQEEREAEKRAIDALKIKIGL